MEYLGWGLDAAVPISQPELWIYIAAFVSATFVVIVSAVQVALAWHEQRDRYRALLWRHELLESRVELLERDSEALHTWATHLGVSLWQ